MTKRCLFLEALICLILVVTSSRNVIAEANGDPPSNAGAIADSQPRIYKLHSGIEVQVFDSARNKLDEKDTLRWSQMGYYYLTPLRLVKDGSGKGARRLKLGKKQFVVFDIKMDVVNSADLVKLVKNQNPLVKGEMISPLSYHELEVSMPGLASSHLISGSGNKNLGQAITAMLEVSSPEEAQDAIEAINSGVILPNVRVTVLQKLSGVNQYELNWNRIAETKHLQDYLGPSGPDFITAAQELDMKIELNESIKESAWVEAPGQTREKAFEWIMDRLRNPTPQARSLDTINWIKETKVDVLDLTKFNNLTREIAFNAKNTNDDQWCRKYSDLWERDETSTRITAREVTIPIKKIIVGAKDKAKKNKILNEKRQSNTEDCGRNFVEKQFDYKKEGEIWVPKSIFVYQNLRGKANDVGVLTSDTFLINQRLSLIDLQVERN